MDASDAFLRSLEKYEKMKITRRWQIKSKIEYEKSPNSFYFEKRELKNG